jgi:hypothetical protein
MWTVEHASSRSPKDGRWDVVIEQSEKEAFEQAQKYIDRGLVVNSILGPSGAIAYTQAPVYARLKRSCLKPGRLVACLRPTRVFWGLRPFAQHAL